MAQKFLDLAEVGAGEGDEPTVATPEGEAAKIALLEKALDRYRSAIVIMQAQLNQQQQERAGSKAMIEKLESEIQSLREQLKSIQE